jgi:hypothetical protein
MADSAQSGFGELAEQFLRSCAGLVIEAQL